MYESLPSSRESKVPKILSFTGPVQGILTIPVPISFKTAEYVIFVQQEDTFLFFLRKVGR